MGHSSLAKTLKIKANFAKNQLELGYMKPCAAAGKK
jgi:hypothetical protein